jgi:predicted short-subunit dehydrogenase-like oxidoreductase (DUF2520 family)
LLVHVQVGGNRGISAGMQKARKSSARARGSKTLVAPKQVAKVGVLPPLHVQILGAGKVGAALARELKRVKWPVTVHSARKGLPRTLAGDVLVLAIRDRDLSSTLDALVASTKLPKTMAVVHCAGSLGPDVLAAIRPFCAGVAQMHPMISFASSRVSPNLARGNMRVSGDPIAVARAIQLAKSIGMTPRKLIGTNPIGYHAAAAFVANGSAALAGLGIQILTQAGVGKKQAPKLMGPLLRSVADNIEALGMPDALTGPVRRGDAGALTKHAGLLQTLLPETVSLYWALVEAQLPFAEALGEFGRVEAKTLRETTAKHKKQAG